MKFLLAFGFAFELPLTLTLLSRVGLVKPEQLIKFRRHAAMIALIVSAVITPDATLFTMMLMAVPLIVLYEAGIWGAKWFGQRKTPVSEESEDIDGESLSDDETTPST